MAKHLSVLIPALLLAGCARDVILKPAVIGFNTKAQASIDAVEQHYDATIVRLNRQAADFLAANPDCGLRTDIVPRRLNRGATRTGGFCLTDAEQAALPDTARVITTKLPIVSRDNFAPQFAAVSLLADYVAFLGEYADDPRSTSKAEITATANALTALGTGIRDLKVAVEAATRQPPADGAAPPPDPVLKEFAPGGAVEKFAGAVGDIAEQVELIADQANDVNALEGRIRASVVPINAAIDGLVTNADLWTCAAFERRKTQANDYAVLWSPKLPELELEARRDIANTWIGLQNGALPGYCRGGTGPGVHSQVGAMLVGIKAANTDLARLADHKYTPAERKAIAEATLTRLGALLSRLAAVVPLLP